jgi:hypothetical protein
MITLTEQLVEARRELARRRTSYPQCVKRGVLDMTTAYYQLQAQEAIVQTLECVEKTRERLESDQPQMPLL